MQSRVFLGNQQAMWSKQHNGKAHIPPDYVVDRCATDGGSGSHRDFLFRPHGWTRGRRQISERITSVISMACHFTTKPGGIWKKPQHGRGV